VLGLAIGGIPAVHIAALIVKNLSMPAIRWMVGHALSVSARHYRALAPEMCAELLSAY
jgi:hypothetical protein